MVSELVVTPNDSGRLSISR